jgi:hypothetical protein
MRLVGSTAAACGLDAAPRLPPVTTPSPTPPHRVHHFVKGQPHRRPQRLPAAARAAAAAAACPRRRRRAASGARARLLLALLLVLLPELLYVWQGLHVPPGQRGRVQDQALVRPAARRVAGAP